ncbi:hypothetical protein HY993_00350 [Candidatus Micrarchaeota archaeon]|nr:hypothetical protein [Candidatus Micrarchaeota archaeon]
MNAELARIGQHSADLANFLARRHANAKQNVDKSEISGHIESIDKTLRNMKGNNVNTEHFTTGLMANLQKNSIGVVRTSDYLKTIEHVSRNENPMRHADSLLDAIKALGEPEYRIEIEVHEAIRKISGKGINSIGFIKKLHEKLDANGKQAGLTQAKRIFFKKEIKAVMQAVQDGLDKKINPEKALEHAWKNADALNKKGFEKALEEVSSGKIR